MKKLYLLILIGFMAITLQSQNTERPWLVGVSTNYADFYAVEMKFSVSAY